MPLTKEDINNALANNPYEGTIRHSISNYFEDLEEPVAVAISISPPVRNVYTNEVLKDDGYYERGIFYENTDKIVDLLRENGIDAVSFMDKEAANPAKFVVNGNGVVCPFMKPEDALKATVMIETIVRDNDFQLTGHANPMSVKNMLYSSVVKPERKGTVLGADNIIDIKSSHPNSDRFAELEDKYGNYQDFVNKKINEAYANSELVDFASLDNKNVYGGGEFLYRGGSLGANPYATISEFNSRKIAHSSPAPSVCANFSGKGHSFSSKGGAVYETTKDGIEYGFIYKLRSMGDEQKYYQNVGLETASSPKKMNESNREWDGHRGDVYESPVVPHHNKLEAIYVHIGKTGEDKLFEIPLDENGNIKDKEWRDFMEMHEPTDDKVIGYMAQRQDIQKREQTANPNHFYSFELKDNLQKDSQEYLKDISTKDFISCFTHKSNLAERDDGVLVMKDNLHLSSVKMTSLPDLSNLSVEGSVFFNTVDEIKATNLPETKNGVSSIGSKVIGTNDITTEKLVKIIGAEKNEKGWYYIKNGHNNLNFDGIPKKWNETKFVELPDFCNFEYDNIDQIPETRRGIGMSGVTIKNQNSIENMPIDKFLYKIKGNVGTRRFPPALDSEEFTPIEKNSNLVIGIDKTNIATFPKGFNEYSVEQIVMNSAVKVNSLDNFPVTKQGTFALSFDGDLKNETMLSFLQKTKGTDWIQANTSVGDDGHLIINGNFDFRAPQWDEKQPTFSITSLPKDFDNVEIKGRIEPNNVSTFVYYHKQIKQDIDRKCEDLIIPIENQKDFTLSELKCSRLEIEGSGKISEKLPDGLEYFTISKNKNLEELFDLPNSCKHLSITESNVNTTIDVPKSVNSIHLYKSMVEHIPVLNQNIEQIKLIETEFKRGEFLDLSKCKDVELNNIKIPDGATLDLSGCQKVRMSGVDLSKCNVIMPNNANSIILNDIKLPDDYKMDLSSCKAGNIHNVQCAEIMLPKRCSEMHTIIPNNVREVTTEFLASTRIEQFPKNIKVIDSIDENGNKIPLKSLKRRGVANNVIKTLRNQRIKEQLLSPIKKLRKMFQRKSNNVTTSKSIMVKSRNDALTISALRGTDRNYTDSQNGDKLTKEDIKTVEAISPIVLEQNAEVANRDNINRVIWQKSGRIATDTQNRVQIASQRLNVQAQQKMANNSRE